MPTYDYRCEKRHTFELFHGINDNEPRTCPKCGSPAKRVPSGGGGLLFKGSGFHVTDYRSKGYRERAKADQPSKPAADMGGKGASPPPSAGAKE